MGTKNISFTRDLEQYIDAKVASGEYAHASEVVRDGVRLLMRQEADKLEWLRNAISEGLASPIVDKTTDEIFDDIKRHGRAMLEARRKMQQ